MNTTENRFLRPTAQGFDVYADGERIGSVVPHGEGFRALTRRGDIPMPNGSVMSLPRQSYETRSEPIHATPQDAARMLLLAVETGRILNAQIAYERANGWSTD